MNGTGWMDRSNKIGKTRDDIRDWEEIIPPKDISLRKSEIAFNIVMYIMLRFIQGIVLQGFLFHLVPFLPVTSFLYPTHFARGKINRPLLPSSFLPLFMVTKPSNNNIVKGGYSRRMFLTETFFRLSFNSILLPQSSHAETYSIDNSKPIRLWIDTDPSGLVYTGLDCDDDLAVLLALALEQNHLIHLEGISICGGNAPLAHTWPDIHKLLNHAGSSTTHPVVKGYGWRSMQVAWKTSRFFNSITPDIPNSEEATKALIDLSYRTSPVSILMLGPPTNLARAIEGGRLKIKGGAIQHVYLMGGELTGQPLDLNFRSDRAAARTVLESELPTTIIPIQTCGQVSVTQAYIDNRLQCPDMAVCALVPKMKQQVKIMPQIVNPAVQNRLLGGEGNLSNDHTTAAAATASRWKPSSNLGNGFIPWDVVALLSITHPQELFEEWEFHRVSIPTCGDEGRGEPCDKRMRVVENLGTDWNGKNWSGVVRVPHKIKSETELLNTMFDLLGQIPAASPTPPPLFWGFISTCVGLGAGIFGTISFLFWRAL